MYPPDWRLTFSNDALPSTTSSLLASSTTSSLTTSLFTSSILTIVPSSQSIASPTVSVLPTMTNSVAVAISTSTSPTDDPENTGECELLGPFAILIQAALGALALLALVYKRWRERPQRPIKIWAFDASKQVFGSVLLHLLNLIMSMFSAGHVPIAAISAVEGTKYKPNPCSFYLLNLAIDTTIGIPILIVILRVLHIGISYTPLVRPSGSIQSGYYGDPPKVTWWLKQSIIYFIGLLCMKFCVFLIFQFLPWIVRVGDWALRWTEGNEAIQIAFVMLIFPTIMNALQYYIIDAFIKKNPSEDDDTQKADGAGAGVRTDIEEEERLLEDDDSHHEAPGEHDRTEEHTRKGDCASKIGAGTTEREFHPDGDSIIGETATDKTASGDIGEEDPVNKSPA